MRWTKILRFPAREEQLTSAVWCQVRKQQALEVFSLLVLSGPTWELQGRPHSNISNAIIHGKWGKTEAYILQSSFLSETY